MELAVKGSGCVEWWIRVLELSRGPRMYSREEMCFANRGSTPTLLPAYIQVSESTIKYLRSTEIAASSAGSKDG